MKKSVRWKKAGSESCRIVFVRRMRLLSILFVCVDDEEREQLQKFAFICNLSFDVYVKKQLIEKMVDELPKPNKKK